MTDAPPLSPEVILLYLEGNGTATPAGLSELAEQWPLHIVDARQAGQLLALSTTAAVLLAQTDQVTDALRLAQEHAARVHALVLLSPPAFTDALQGASLEALDKGLVATLLVHGSELEGEAEARAHTYKRAWPHSQLVYLYSAGESSAWQRPEAFAGLVRDFIVYQEGFVVNRSVTHLFP